MWLDLKPDENWIVEWIKDNHGVIKKSDFHLKLSVIIIDKINEYFKTLRFLL